MDFLRSLRCLLFNSSHQARLDQPSPLPLLRVSVVDLFPHVGIEQEQTEVTEGGPSSVLSVTSCSILSVMASHGLLSRLSVSPW